MMKMLSLFRNIYDLYAPPRLVRFLKTPAGNTGIEYALIAAGIAIAILAVVFTAGNSLENFFGFLSDQLIKAEAKR